MHIRVYYLEDPRRKEETFSFLSVKWPDPIPLLFAGVMVGLSKVREENQGTVTSESSWLAPDSSSIERLKRPTELS